MAPNYNLPRQATARPAATSNTSRYALKRQDPLTEGAAMAEKQNNVGLATGQFADVQSAQGATDRANALRTSQGLQAARGTVARAGGDFSPEAALRAQDQAFAASSAQNLNASNGVNQLQRQYRNDALNRSAEFEANAQASAKEERNYQTGRDDTQYDRTTDAARYGDTRADVAYNQGEDKRRYDQGFGANREDAATAKDQFSQTLQNQKEQFGVTSGQSQQQIDNQKSQFGETLADSRSRYDLSRGDANSQFAQTFGANREDAATAKDQFSQTFGANREDAATAKEQWGQTFDANRSDTAWNQNNTVSQQADDRNRYDLSRQDSNSQFAQTFGANREDAATAKDQFAVTSGQNQQQIENQAAQAAAQMGYNYASLSQEDKHYLQTMVQQDSQFAVTSGQSQQQINNQSSQFDLTRQDANTQQALDNTRYDQTYTDQRGDINYDRANADRLEGKGDALASINAIQDPKAKQAAYNAYINGEDVSQFITGTLYDQYGGLNGGADSPYASATPGEITAQAKIDELRSYYPDKTDSELQQMALDERTQDRTVSRAPVEAATQTAAAQTAATRLSNLQAGQVPSAEDIATLPSVTTQSIPLGGATNTFLQSSTTGGWTKINGTPYKVVKGGNTTPGSAKGDYAVMQDTSGAAVYLLPDGSITKTQPKAPATATVSPTNSSASRYGR